MLEQWLLIPHPNIAETSRWMIPLRIFSVGHAHAVVEQMGIQVDAPIELEQNVFR